MKALKSKRNRTIVVSDEERMELSCWLLREPGKQNQLDGLLNKIMLGDTLDLARNLPNKFVDLLILDPPYNLNKKFGDIGFKKTDIDTYSDYADKFLLAMLHTLKDTASIYLCGDWYTSTSLHLVSTKYFYVRNRITWQREKGRGAKANWKNAHEDIWFCTKSNKFTFNMDSVKVRKKVIAPYREKGLPKDWEKTKQGNFRNTCPSNLWDDITVPFWSMPENTVHPTQKPEKLIAKLILASSDEGNVVFDPFAGSGTSCVVAKKLNRNYLGIEIDEDYACLAQKRLDAVNSPDIQGYSGGVFWERNTLSIQPGKKDVKVLC